MKEKLVLLVLIALIGLFVVHCLYLNFTQDDAFISFRYLRNFLSGYGLVFNSGERVEGYTNFFWIIFLSLLVRLGLDVVFLSKFLGVTSGGITVFLLYLISSKYVDKKYWYLAFLPSLFLVANSSFAYWSISGLESSFFALVLLLSFWAYSFSRDLSLTFLALSSLIRPEGFLVSGLFILYQLIGGKVSWKEFARYLILYLLPLLPYLVFKYFYYGDLLPNTFYAKAGFTLENLSTGLAYFWDFLRHYGFWGIGYIIPLFLYGSLDKTLRMLVWVLFGYTIYIILVGGDFLKVHRFFVPLLSLLYLFLGIFIVQLYLKLKGRLFSRGVLILLTILALGITFFLSESSVLKVRKSEQTLVDKMSYIGQKLDGIFGSDLTIAASTIGAISYNTRGTVIDMLGLTDEYIARNPEKIEGIPASWKEKKYNATYVLSRDPDFILFSTSHRPSAPAERALFLHSKFRQNYYRFWVRKGEDMHSMFKRKWEYRKGDEVFRDAKFIDFYSEAIHLYFQGEFTGAIAQLSDALKSGPKDFSWVYEDLGMVYWDLEDTSTTCYYLNKIIQLDDYAPISYLILARLDYVHKKYSEALRRLDKVDFYNPGLLKGGKRENIKRRMMESLK